MCGCSTALLESTIAAANKSRPRVRIPKNLKVKSGLGIGTVAITVFDSVGSFRNLDRRSPFPHRQDISRARRIGTWDRSRRQYCTPTKYRVGSDLDSTEQDFSGRFLAGEARSAPMSAQGLALLWQIYSRCRSLQIDFRQCGHRCGGSRAKRSRMACSRRSPPAPCAGCPEPGPAHTKNPLCSGRYWRTLAKSAFKASAASRAALSSNSGNGVPFSASTPKSARSCCCQTLSRVPPCPP
jgi:hypothetical protein